MDLMQRRAARRPGVTAAVVSLVAFLALLAGVLWIASIPSADCSPAAREAATSRDASRILAGGMSITEAVEREVARGQACGS